MIYKLKVAELFVMRRLSIKLITHVERDIVQKCMFIMLLLYFHNTFLKRGVARSRQ